jgi:hypothetical protein
MSFDMSQKFGVQIHNMISLGTDLLEVQGATTSQDEVILVSKSLRHPDDPLNWSRWRKVLHVSLIYPHAYETGVGGTSTYSILVDMSKDTGLTLTRKI